MFGLEGLWELSISEVTVYSVWNQAHLQFDRNKLMIDVTRLLLDHLEQWIMTDLQLLFFALNLLQELARLADRAYLKEQFVSLKP